MTLEQNKTMHFYVEIKVFKSRQYDRCISIYGEKEI
jgi:hypothetical protein